MRHRSSGGFVHGGQAGAVYADNASDALLPVIASALNLDEMGELDVIGTRDADGASRAELVYGSEAWNAFNRGHKVRKERRSMELYHGSPFDFDGRPNLSMSKGYRDFGAGFYLAENPNDSLSIAVKDTYYGFLYTYEIDEPVLERLSVLSLDDGYDEEWARVVYDCRMNGGQSAYDVIIGETAGGRVNDLFEGYRRNSTPFEQAVGEILRETTNSRFGTQWCLSTEAALDLIELVDKEKITR